MPITSPISFLSQESWNLLLMEYDDHFGEPQARQAMWKNTPFQPRVYRLREIREITMAYPLADAVIWWWVWPCATLSLIFYL